MQLKQAPTLVLSNEFALENEQDGANFDSPVNNFAIAGSLGYLTQQFAYTDQYGAIGSHDPEEFFTRLFRNKYEQDPSPIQIARGGGTAQGKWHRSTGIPRELRLGQHGLECRLLQLHQQPIHPQCPTRCGGFW